MFYLMFSFDPPIWRLQIAELTTLADNQLKGVAIDMLIICSRKLNEIRTLVFCLRSPMKIEKERLNRKNKQGHSFSACCPNLEEVLQD